MPKWPIDAQRSRLLRTLQDNPALPSLLQTLPPASLARLVDRVGLNDASELMALAPTRNLLQALDESLWKSPRPGAAEVFDVRELVDWLEAWNEIGDTFVAERLAAMSDDYRALCVSHLVCVRIHHTLAFLDIPDDEVDVERDTLLPTGSYALYGPYMLTAVIEDEWEVIRASLDALWSEEPECLLRTLGMLDGAESMLAAQEARLRLSRDVAHERERHRENLGYVTGPGAGAFLLFAATASIDELVALTAYDEETRRHLAAFGASTEDDPAHDEATEQPDPPTPQQLQQLQQLRSTLEREHVLMPQATLLLTDQSGANSSALTRELSLLAETDQMAFERCARELAYLANVLKVGTRARGALLEDTAARDLAYATCERGLEVLGKLELDLRLAQEPGLIRLFAIGWRTRPRITSSREA